MNRYHKLAVLNLVVLSGHERVCYRYWTMEETGRSIPRVSKPALSAGRYCTDCRHCELECVGFVGRLCRYLRLYLYKIAGINSPFFLLPRLRRSFITGDLVLN